MNVASILVAALGVYLACGLVFAVPFVLVGVNRIDPHAKPGTWGFRLLMLPGTVFLWPLLLRRWMSGAGEPPVERNAHRNPARKSQLA
jgi:hypothetical protein